MSGQNLTSFQSTPLKLSHSGFIGTAMAEAKDVMSISEFFAEKTLFVTGGTGFLGKIMIEKLLWACPSVKKIYLLTRSRRGIKPQQRIDELLQTNVFDRVREMGDDWKRKIVPVEGDIAEENLGISDEDWKMLQEGVEVVFHSAATVRFDEDLKDALRLNLHGTQNVIKLCRGMKHLEVLVHVSTAYANCDQDSIEERVYPPPVDPEKLTSSIGWMDNNMVNALTPHLIGKRPNTYTFTKSLAEHVLLQEADNFPIAIFRPSIIGAAWKEPFEGWVDNFNGPSGLFVAAGKGMLRSMMGELNAVADIIPVDFSANMMLAIAWHRVTKKHSGIPIYHLTTGLLNGCTWGEICSHVSASFQTYPFEGVFRRPNFAFESRKLMHSYWCYISHKIPAFIADMTSFCAGQRPKMNKLYGKLERATRSLIYFTTRSWEFSMENYRGLIQDMSPQDREIFNFDVEKIEWENYLKRFTIGLKTFLLKEDLANLPVAHSRIRKLRNIRWTMYFCLFLFVSWLIIKRFPAAQTAWTQCLSGVHKLARALEPFKLSN